MPKAVVLGKAEGKPGQVYYPLELTTLPEQQDLKPNDVRVRILAAALNHRDFFQRQHLYPGTTFGVALLADGAGIVTATGSSAKQWQGKRVILNPGQGWKDDVEGPEKAYAILGGTKYLPLGTLTESLVVDAGEIEEAPAHLSAVQAAALPLTGLTGWRAVVTKSGNFKEGRNVLITGIGGGVALQALSFAVAVGANVYVTSGNEEKIKKAKELGAKGGVIYKEKDWDKKLLELLPKERKWIDAIIDGAGADVVEKAQRIVRHGGTVVSYGMTTAPKIAYTMGAVLKNIDVRGSTMGSRKEFADMVKFVSEKKIVPVVSRTVSGIDNLKGIDSLFEDMKNASQFGKLVVELEKEDGQSKL